MPGAKINLKISHRAFGREPSYELRSLARIGPNSHFDGSSSDKFIATPTGYTLLRFIDFNKAAIFGAR